MSVSKNKSGRNFGILAAKFGGNFGVMTMFCQFEITGLSDISTALSKPVGTGGTKS
jgi:hypothetical protein